MSKPLPRLRRELDIMPSPVPEQPGLFIRDPFRYTESMIIVPPILAQSLVLFDGQKTELDLHSLLVQATGDLGTGEAGRDLTRTLRECGFVETEEFHEMRDRKHREFADADHRTASHAGAAYPDEPEPLRQQLREYGVSHDASVMEADSLIALAAPHVSPHGGFKSYAAAYRRLHPGYADKTFVILGTSHYGEPEKFGLTRKSYVTPLGGLETDRDMVDWLEQRAPDSVVMEDYCHATEHSIEFQCVFLQYALNKPDVKVVPILCGPLTESLFSHKAPETKDSVRRFFDALREMAEQHRDRLVWILGIDLAHIGRRYGDDFIAQSEQGLLQEVRARDEARLREVCAGNAEGFYELIHPDQDDLRWCGYSPVYTFLASVKGVRGRVLSYEQWNIDEQSVVSFTGMDFTKV